ncbi:uncharacterized protein LOC9639541 [Selaginella moellendorffii]|uniref:uncharacterized protein LOC9639541 n=1 Tax=Selaginella moellendorffii TaxID=88036 RepID=UPI000D1CB975|nr:uncharacterized protein LOC9639541 [Selaginella moellendorffii]|eukprot:XP_024520984.1 uncharacterized protein LOC9639541 [Selaginella moellendorffii]
MRMLLGLPQFWTLPLLVVILSQCSLALVIDYSYVGARGPRHWGDLKSDWKECSDGKAQSPIAIRSKHAELNSSLPGLRAHYQSSVCSIASSQYIFKVFIAGAHCTLPLNRATYTLTDFHFHIPSEHTVDGTRFPLELHLVHKVAPNSSQITVVSKLFKLGRSDPLLDQILKLKGGNATINLSNYINLHGGYYRYLGSLTTPPCSEGILWTILKKTGTVSSSQIKRVIALLQGKNARPLQKINKRAIYKHSS